MNGSFLAQSLVASHWNPEPPRMWAQNGPGWGVLTLAEKVTGEASRTPVGRTNHCWALGPAKPASTQITMKAPAETHIDDFIYFTPFSLLLLAKSLPSWPLCLITAHGGWNTIFTHCRNVWKDGMWPRLNPLTFRLSPQVCRESFSASLLSLKNHQFCCELASVLSLFSDCGYVTVTLLWPSTLFYYIEIWFFL